MDMWDEDHPEGDLEVMDFLDEWANDETKSAGTGIDKAFAGIIIIVVLTMAIILCSASAM